MTMTRVKQHHTTRSGVTRNLALSNQLAGILLRAAMECDLDVHVVSGGQPPKGTSSRRVGSTRHDVGGGRMGAADVQLLRAGNMLAMTNAADVTHMAKYVTFCVAEGANGVGAGVAYMGPSTIHIGGGGSAVWGGLKPSDRAPDWLVRAHADGMRKATAPKGG
jgi:hypothetical protein